jgi:hypothetical protein
MVAALVRRLPVCLLQQALLRKALHGSGDGGARTEAHLWLTLVSIVVAWWSNDIFVTFVTLGIFVLVLMIAWWNFHKKNYFLFSDNH